MWPFNNPKPDSLTEVLIKEIELLAQTPRNWTKGNRMFKNYPVYCVIHECGNFITEHGDLVSDIGYHIPVSNKQSERLKECYNNIVTTWALSSCLKKKSCHKYGLDAGLCKNPTQRMK